MTEFPAEPRVLIYTVSRAVGAEGCQRALNVLREGRKLAGHNHDWLLWCNSPDMLRATVWGWDGLRDERDGGDNLGQHIPLRHVLARAEGKYDFLVRVDDDLEWLTSGWLRKLLDAERKVFAYSGKMAVMSAHVLGLIHEIQKLAFKMDRMRIYAAPIAGGACRLHHLSFFDGYEPDCRRAMGAGDATSIAQHAEETHIPIFILPSVRVRHDTRAHIERDPRYAREHELMQRIPYIPPWRGVGPQEEAPDGKPDDVHTAGDLRPPDVPGGAAGV